MEFFWQKSARLQRKVDGLEAIVKSGLTETSALFNTILNVATDSGEPVTIQKALRLTDVTTCLNINGESLAQTPKNVILDQGTEKQIQRDHPVQTLLNKKMSDFSTSYNYFYSVGWLTGAYGNQFGLINRQFDRTPTEVIPTDNSKIEMRSQKGEVFYFWEGQSISPEDILHFKLYSTDGLTGTSPILLNREIVGVALKQHRYRATLYDKIPAGYWSSTQHNINQEQADKLNETWRSLGMSDTKFIPWGLEMKKFGLTAEETELGFSLQDVTQKLYAIWRIPKILGQEYQDANFANAVQQDLTFVKHNLLPRCESIEQELTDKLFTESEKRAGYRVNCDLKGFLKADPKTEAEAMRSAIFSGTYTPKEWRERMGEDSTNVPDIHMTQSNMIPVDMMEEFTQSMIDKNKRGSGVQVNGKKLNGHAEHA